MTHNKNSKLSRVLGHALAVRAISTIISNVVVVVVVWGSFRQCSLGVCVCVFLYVFCCVSVFETNGRAVQVYRIGTEIYMCLYSLILF